MDKTSRTEILHDAKKWIYEAGKLIRTEMVRPFKINSKRDRKDLVTEIDEMAERFLYSKINSKYEHHQVLGEEGMGDDVRTLDGTVWIIDPIDGTMNFVHQKRNFAISVGIYHDGIGEIGLIYDVMADVMYEGIKDGGAFKNGVKLEPLDENKTIEESLIGINSFWSTRNRRLEETKIHELIRTVKGTRSYGSAALEFAFIAEGIIDAYITMRLSPWDIAAGMIIINEVGGMTTQADQSPINLLGDNSIIACNKAIHDSLAHFIQLKK